MLPKGAARILQIDLSSGDQRITECTDQALIKKTLGGRGLATYLYLRDFDLSLEPFDERAPLMFASGSLSGTNVPSAGRTSIIFKSPATKSFFKSNVGGHFGAAMKWANWDIITVVGKAKKPCYIYIHNDSVEIRDAEDLWGLDSRELAHTLQKRHGDDALQVAGIGPAGENLVMFASIQASIYNAAARGGGGAVMGSKNLKCIAVHGSNPIGAAQPEALYDTVARVSKQMDRTPSVKGLTAYGTSVSVESTNLMECFPTRNFQQGSIDNIVQLTGQNLVHSNLLKNRMGCFGCPICCHRYCTLETGRYAGAYSGGPEYETLCSLGAGCGSTDTESVIKANELCNIYGMDVISTGSVIQWLFECKQRGLVSDKDAGGLPLDWGNGDTVVALTHMIARRDGIGDLLADGVKLASEKLGGDSYKWAIQAKGLEQSRIETRSAFSYALAFAINSRGPDHLNTEPLAEFGSDPAMVGVIKKITGSEKYAYPTTTEKRPEIVRWHEDIYASGDAMGICAFPTTAQFWMDEFDLAELFSHASGIPITAEELMLVGKHIIMMERMCVAMMGYGRERDMLPYRLMHEKQLGAKHDHAINTPDMLEPMKDRYYELHGWEQKRGWPTVETIQDAGFSELIPKYMDYLERWGGLPE